MGYRSNFQVTLHSKVDKKDMETIARVFRDVTEYDFEVSGTDTLYLDDAKWYGWVENMQIISARFPTMRFEVHAFGEDGEQEIVDALNGETDQRRGEMVFPKRTLWEDK